MQALIKKKKNSLITLVSPEREGFASRNHCMVACLSSAEIFDARASLSVLPVWKTLFCVESKALLLVLALFLYNQDLLLSGRLNKLRASWTSIPSVRNDASSPFPLSLQFLKAVTTFSANFWFVALV